VRPRKGALKQMKGPTEKKKATETAEVLTASGLETYTRSTDAAVMVQIAPRTAHGGPLTHRDETLW
jgi:hypothetical protein